MSGLRIVPFWDAHVEDAAGLLAARHARHHETEPLLPAEVDFRAQIEGEWSADGASGVFASRGDVAVGYLFGRPQATGWFTVGIGGHAVEGDAQGARDLYGAAAGARVAARDTPHPADIP